VNNQKKIIFLWTDISGYMAACWRALSLAEGVEVKVLAYGSSQATAFSSGLMAGIDWHAMSESERNDPDFLERQIVDFDAEVVVLSGWLNPAYRKLPFRQALQGKRFVMGMDTPWWGNLKQYLARFALWSYLSRINKVVVTGERCWQYAIRLGFDQSQIVRGLYGVDYASLSKLYERRCALSEWPKQFLFAGRYSQEKGIDLLLQAYTDYRKQVENPWPLVCCGKGPLGDLLKGQEGVVDRGFLQPAELHEEMVRSGCFILPSEFDPWPLILVEACAAGLPVISTEVCGSSVELVRSHHSGFSVAVNDLNLLTLAMLQAHRHSRLPQYGEYAMQLASAYSAEVWVERWLGDVFSG